MNKQWIKKGDNIYCLIFTPFYEEQHIVTLKIDEDGDVCAACPMLRYINEYIGSINNCSIESIQTDIEDMIEEHYRNESEYYKQLYEAFKAGGQAE